MTPRDITALTTDLRALGGQRVWSLMISLFGDLAQGEGDQIEGPLLSAIMSALDIKPEAVRVALHRLRNDGWLTSAKAGRISRHSLTPKGRSESAAVSPRIYAHPEEIPQDWQIVLLETADLRAQDNLASDGYLQLLPRVFMGPAKLTAPAGALAVQGQNAPDWILDQLLPRDILEGYERLYQTLSTLAIDLPDPQDLSALETAILRCLIVHNWRRLVLKHPAPPAALVSKDTALSLCHTLVSELLDRFPRPALTVIAQEQAAA